MTEVMEVPVPLEASSPATAAAESLDEFLQTGRVGRRNALPDILTEPGANAAKSEDLLSPMEKLSCSDTCDSGSGQGSPGSESQPQPTTSTRESECCQSEDEQQSRT